MAPNLASWSPTGYPVTTSVINLRTSFIRSFLILPDASMIRTMSTLPLQPVYSKQKTNKFIIGMNKMELIGTQSLIKFLSHKYCRVLSPYIYFYFLSASIALLEKFFHLFLFFYRRWLRYTFFPSFSLSQLVEDGKHL